MWPIGSYFQWHFFPMQTKDMYVKGNLYQVFVNLKNYHNMDSQSLKDLFDTGRTWDLLSYLGWEALIPGLGGLIVLLIGAFIGYQIAKKKGAFPKLIGTIIILASIVLGGYLAVTAIFSNLSELAEEKIHQTFELAETKGWLDGLTFEMNFRTERSMNNKLGIETPYLVYEDVPVTFNMPGELLDKLKLIRETLGITRIHNLAGWRGDFAIPFDLVYVNGQWTIGPYPAYEEAVKRGEAPANFTEDWLYPQLRFVAYEHLSAVQQYECCGHQNAKPIEFNPQLWQIESWAPAASPFEGDEEARLREGPFDYENKRHLYLPNGERISSTTRMLDGRTRY